jgi:hypothetical protein
MTQEPKPIIIEQFNKGIAPSPHVGFGEIRNIDLTTYPGVAQINYALEKVSSTTVVDKVKWIVPLQTIRSLL